MEGDVSVTHPVTDPAKDLASTAASSPRPGPVAGHIAPPSASLAAANGPDLATMGQRFLPEAPTSRIVIRLHALLNFIDPRWSLEQQLDWLEQLSDWLHRRGWPRGSRQTSMNLLIDNDPRTLHLQLLVNVLTHVPPWRASFSALMRSVLGQMQATRLFSDIGLPQEPGFWREATARIGESLLPRPPSPTTLSELLARILPTIEDAQWLLRVPRELLDKFLRLLHDTESQRRDEWGSLRTSILDAVTVLTARVCALGLANDVWERLPETQLEDLPFLRLQRVCDALIRAARSAAADGVPASGGGQVTQAFLVIKDCQQAVQQVLSHLEDYGVSVDLVYRLELINAMLGRLEELLNLLYARQSTGLGHEGAHFVAELIQAQVQRRSVRALFRTSTHQLARKIVERTGKSGEKYITETPAEWRSMLLAGCGAGVLTAGTAIVKFLSSGWALPAFFAGFFASLNYASFFVVIQLCHFTLATKQPSMTAAALAAAISERQEGDHFERLVALIARMTRSQLAAALGNIGAVIPTVLLFDWLYRFRTGHAFLSHHDAEHTVSSLQPLRALPFAVLTGVYLWLSSIAAGWLENWAVYHRLPAAIAGNRRLRRIFGSRFAEFLGRALDHHISGIGGVVTLGFVLGMSPVVGQFFGIPSEVRHVTLSSGALTFAASADLAANGVHALLEKPILLAWVGIVFILFANFGVSFLLALLVALRAREVPRRELLVLLRTVLSRIMRSPLEFLFPVKRPPTQS